jgi:hypothetical protein
MKKVLVFLFITLVMPLKAFASIPDYTEFWYDKDKNSVFIWLRHYSEDPQKHRISKYQVFFPGRKFTLLNKKQISKETTVEIPLGNFYPKKGTEAIIRLTCSKSGSKNYPATF